MTSPILFEREGPIAWMILNDPDRLNALTDRMGKGIARRVPLINKDRSIRAVILTGAGRAFSAGGNLEMIEERTRKKNTINQREMIRFYKQILSILKVEVPVIAMINGPAVGAAFCMTLACDLRIASREARMGANFVRLGLSPGMGGTFLMPRILGVATAMDLLLTGRLLTADEALQKGIVHQVHSSEDLKAATLRLAGEIAANSPLAVRMAKKGILANLKGFEKARLFEARGQALSFRTDDLKEGIAAIRNKRLPQFHGN